MGDIVLWKYCAWLALFSSPAIPIVFAWRRLLSGGRARTSMDLVRLSIATVSLCWFDAAIIDVRCLGSLYGDSHYAIIGGNWIGVLVSALTAFVFSGSSMTRTLRLATAFACVLLVLEWSWIGLVDR
jgi:hypothetical protein